MVQTSLRNVPVTPTPVFFQKYCRTNGGRTAVQMGGVLQYKWEAYCRVSLSSKLRSQESMAIQMGAYCRTNWRCTAVLFSQVVGFWGLGWGFRNIAHSPSTIRNENSNYYPHDFFGMVKSTPDPDTFEKYRDTPPISIAILLQKYALLLQKVVYTPPICIAIWLPFVSRYFCRGIGVRGRWDTPNTYFVG